METCRACKSNQDKCENGVCEIKTLRAYVKELEETLSPLATIWSRFLVDGLDEARPYWGDSQECDIQIFSGRGGKELLTLQDCRKAYDLITEIE